MKPENEPNVEVEIEKALVEVNITEQVLTKIKEDYMPLKVKDIYDKPGFSAVETARKEVKKLRIMVEKHMKKLREPAQAFRDAVIAKEKEIVARLEEVETYLEGQEDIFNRTELEQVKELTPEEKDAALIKAMKTSIKRIAVPTDLTTDAAKAKVVAAVKLLDEAANLLN